MARLISTKCLVFASMIGAISLAMQVFVPGIPVGLGKMELAEVPAILGAAFTNQIGGVLIGFLYGFGSRTILASLPASMFTFGLLGYLAKKLERGWMAIPIVRGFVHPLLSGILSWEIYHGAAVPLEAILILAFYKVIPGVVISVPLYVFIHKKIPLIHLLR